MECRKIVTTALYVRQQKRHRYNKNRFYYLAWFGKKDRVIQRHVGKLTSPEFTVWIPLFKLSKISKKTHPFENLRIKIYSQLESRICRF